jgi:hypothetical protein
MDDRPIRPFGPIAKIALRPFRGNRPRILFNTTGN